MKTFHITATGTAPAYADVNVPTPRAGQVRVMVRASSVNATDIGTASSMFASLGMPHIYPVTLGRDFAGTVTGVGAGVSAFAVGDEVFGELPFAPPLHGGTWADQILSSEDTVVHRPRDVALATAGAAPLAGVTALGVIDALQLVEGETVLLIGATGGVGSLVAQLSAAAGALMIAPARSADESFLTGLGVQRTVPRDGDVVAAARQLHPEGVDAIVDLVTFGQTGVYDGALREGGRVVSTTNAAGDGARRVNVNHAPGFEVLGRLARLLSTGALRIPVSESLSFDELPSALDAFRTKGRHGKVALHRA